MSIMSIISIMSIMSLMSMMRIMCRKYEQQGDMILIYFEYVVACVLLDLPAPPPGLTV